VGVTSSVTRNLEETGSDGKAILKKWKNYWNMSCTGPHLKEVGDNAM
jgi:hypothetical protein